MFLWLLLYGCQGIMWFVRKVIVIFLLNGYHGYLNNYHDDIGGCYGCIDKFHNGING